MKFEQKNIQYNIAKKIGFVVAYFTFTTILFLLLNILDKIPERWGYFNIMAITMIVVLIGFTLRWLLR